MLGYMLGYLNGVPLLKIYYNIFIPFFNTFLNN